jgi:alpha-mannosidase
MILSVRGNHEYEVDRASGHTQLTLVRGVGILGDWFDFYTYDSQCLRKVTAGYAVELYTDEN